MKRAAKQQLLPCACCGFPLLVTIVTEPPPCPACLFDQNHHEPGPWRETWVESGMVWRGEPRLRPRPWQPEQLLASLALRTSLSRVKGRPPRLFITP